MSAAPRARADMTARALGAVEVASGILRSLPAIIDEARAAGLDSLADALEVARAEAERGMGLPIAVVDGLTRENPARR